MLNSNSLILIGGIAAILIAIGATVGEEKSFSQVFTVGPVWATDSWLCTSNEDYIIHGTLRGLAGSQIEIDVSDVGTQSLYTLEPGQLESFSIGATGEQQITITRTGTVTGFITMQTVSGAEANCISL